MSQMTDPMNALNELQIAIDNKAVSLNNCEIYPDLKVLFDEPLGTPRFTYANTLNGKVKAVSLFVAAERMEGIPCFGIGYAVEKSAQQKGLATDIVKKSIEELSNGLKRNGIPKFYVEAIVGTSNIPSIKLAEKLISKSPRECTDEVSGEPAFQYVRLIEQ